MKKLFFAFVLLLAVAGFFLVSKTPEFSRFIFNSNRSGQPAAQTVIPIQSINVTSNGFSPQLVTIKKATKVTWTNNTSTTVNISSDPDPVHATYPALNLGNVNPMSSISLVFDMPGKYGYHDTNNPFHTGTIVVN